MQDAVAAAGGSSQQLSDVTFVLAQIQAAGKITGQDLMQLGQRGINAAELIGSQMGKTGAQIRQEISNGSLDATKAIDMLVAGMSEKFGGAAANVKQTWEGATQRVSAQVRNLGANLTKYLVRPTGGGDLVKFIGAV
ncbi:tape measure protein, partial [Aerococcus urinae]|uniref:tape measure protein n=1 Tax=Aerococcus urinae TaxID=1376 RepID=UPI00254C6C00